MADAFVPAIPAAPVSPEFDPREGLRRAGWLVAVGAGLAGLKSVTGIGLACPFHAVTGLYCPLCGSTRLAVHLLHGQVREAFASNQAVFVGGVVGFVVVLAWLLEVAGGPAVRPSWLSGKRVLRVLIGVAIAWGIVRNLVPGLTPTA